MLLNIKRCTENRARQELQDDSWTISRPIEALEAAISVMYVRVIYGAKNFPRKLLWSQVWRPAFFRNTMSRNQCSEILRFLRFNEKATWFQRLQTDRFATATPICNTFIANYCLLCYKPSENITVDEQLFPCKARCPFIQYVGSKQDKFGIKFWLAVDTSSKYLVNGLPYHGRDVDASKACYDKVSRRQFTFKLGEELAARYVTTRPPAPLPERIPQQSNVRKACQIGGYRGKNRSKNQCANCFKYICGSCLASSECACVRCYDAASGFE
ncbi:hypothetical protein ANN_24415 [Periplaneta americana]|uniref:PiggyBac transposable element-derived protein domain-containing protein n=1 Tax=Periplaneta americana TaxID=6978 RepID=A0ABQ8S3A6_PERAM|nr:hypothetical protein ANN_24415 [Periplaneta americana]